MLSSISHPAVVEMGELQDQFQDLSLLQVYFILSFLPLFVCLPACTLPVKLREGTKSLLQYPDMSFSFLVKGKKKHNVYLFVLEYATNIISIISNG